VSRPGVVTGFLFEGALIARSAAHLPVPQRPLLFAAGADADRAESGARALVEQGAEMLLSFGLAGGLDPILGPGTIIVGEQVVAPDGVKLNVDPELMVKLSAALGNEAVIRPIASACQALTSSADKAALFQATGASAVDMESYGVARAARDLAVPFGILRCVSDPAWRSLPGAALVGIAADGGVRTGAVLGAALRRPWEIWALVRPAFDRRAALQKLRGVGPGLLTAIGL
jgi:adenosylhomocysteine nucleosidase